MTAVWLLGWAKLSSDPSERSRSLRKCRPIMAINNNGGMHLALWLMALSHSSFTWLLCGHQQVRSNVMLSKWALHRVAYNLGLETSAALTKTKKKKKKFICHATTCCRAFLCRRLVWARVLDVHIHPSFSIGYGDTEGDRLCLCGQVTKQPASTVEHTQYRYFTWACQTPVLLTCLLVTSTPFYKEPGEKR